MTIEFIYFDLGMVLLKFSVERMLRQVGIVAMIKPAQVQEILFGSNLHERYEVGQLSTQEYYEAFCQAINDTTQKHPSCESLTLAASDIFEMNTSMIAVVAQLRAAGYRLGILSNTCEAHWQFCYQHYRILRECFEVYALSYELKAVKPQPAIFRRAAELACVAPEKIFFTDDIAGHVAGARVAGFDAVQYVSTPQVVAALRECAVQFNY